MTSSAIATMRVLVKRRKFTLSVPSVKACYFSIPLDVGYSMKASDLRAMLEAAGGSNIIISRWDPYSLTWVYFWPTDPAGSENDFDINYCEGYVVMSKTACEVDIVGYGVTECTYTIPAVSSTNNVLIGMPFDPGIKASDLYSMIKDCESIWNMSGKWESYPPKDFALVCGGCYRIYATNTVDVSFTLSGEPCGEEV